MADGKVLIAAVAAFVVGSALNTSAQTNSSAPATFAGQALPNMSTPLAKVDLDTVYNTDVADSSAAYAANRGLKEEDVSFTPNLDVSLFRQFGQYSVFLNADGGYQFYLRNRILNRETANAIGGATAQISRCQITAGGAYVRRQSDVADLTIATTQNTLELITGETDWVCNQTGKFVPSLSASESFADNSNPLLTTSDYRSFSSHGSISYNRPTFADISIIGSYTNTEFPNREVLVGKSIETDGYQVYSGGLQVERKFGSKLDVLASVSETILKSNFGVDQDFTGITYDGTLTYHPSSRLQIQLEATRQTMPSFVIDTTYSVDQIYKAEVEYQLTSRWLLILGAMDKHQDFVGEALVPGIDLTHQTIKSIYASAGFDISPTLSVKLTVTGNQRNSDIAGYDYSGLLAGLSISKAF